MLPPSGAELLDASMKPPQVVSSPGDGKMLVRECVCVVRVLHPSNLKGH